MEATERNSQTISSKGLPLRSRLESMINSSPSPTLKQGWRRRLEYFVDRVPPTNKIMIVGIGHPLKSDDYVGSLIAKDLMLNSGDEKVIVLDAEQSPENILGKLQEERPGLLILIDSLDMGSAPGTIGLFDLDSVSDTFYATHNIPIRLILDALSDPPTSIVLGIQPGKLGVGGHLSEQVKIARMSTVKELRSIIRRLRGDLDAR